MKKVFITLFVLAFVSLSTFAQEPQQGRSQQQNRRNALPKELNLTEEQQKKVDEINKTYTTKFEELRSKSEGSQEDRRTKMRTLFEEQYKAINDVLTPEQQTKLKEYREKNQNQRRGQGQQGQRQGGQRSE